MPAIINAWTRLVPDRRRERNTRSGKIGVAALAWRQTNPVPEERGPAGWVRGLKKRGSSSQPRIAISPTMQENPRRWLRLKRKTGRFEHESLSRGRDLVV